MERIYSHTQALCPECRKKIHGKIIERDGAVYMDKFCPVHGFSSVLISSDPKWYKESIHYIKPKKDPLDLFTREYKGCPESCGTCTEHQQHTCLPVIEITDGCDLECPVCLKDFAASFSLTEKEFGNILDSLIKYEGHVPVINLSGGEPTLHKDLELFFKMAQKRGIPVTTVSTNGITLLNDKNLRMVFKEYNAVAAVQFDGFKPETSKTLRGNDLSFEKKKLIDILEKENIRFSLTATIAKGINDDEIHDITEFFFQSEALSLMFQPIVLTGRGKQFSEKEHRITIPDIIKEIERSKFISAGDFNPLPCSHFSCFALSYYVKAEDDYMSLKDFLGKEKFLDIIANKTLPGLDRETYSLMKERIYELWSASDISNPAHAVLDRIREALREMSKTGFTAEDSLVKGFESMKGIYIHNFMDIHTMDFGRLIKCCNPYPQSDGKLIPMCSQNVFFQ